MITRIDRRRLLQLSGAGAVAAGSGLAGILAIGTGARLRPDHDGPLAALVRFRAGFG